MKRKRLNKNYYRNLHMQVVRKRLKHALFFYLLEMSRKCKLTAYLKLTEIMKKMKNYDFHLFALLKKPISSVKIETILKFMKTF